MPCFQSCFACVAVAELRTLLLNLQHLVNSFRPDQARSHLADIMKQQVLMKRRLIAALRMARQKADDAYVATKPSTGAESDEESSPQTGCVSSSGEGCAKECGPTCAQASSSCTQAVGRADLSLVCATLDQVPFE
mmetsp:Transcript_791/g.1565  ORF Transcript_791/g.1565 Transcript_791/m.1565 type:complete len:135 (+) Transcript_791:447-851(+)